METYRSNCPVNLALEIIGDKWSLLIIRDMMFENKCYFREFLQGEEKIATNILADRLSKLEVEGIIHKSTDPEHKQKFIYSLTLKGIDLLPLILEMGVWSLKHQPVDMKKHKQATRLLQAGVGARSTVRKELIRKNLKG